MFLLEFQLNHSIIVQQPNIGDLGWSDMMVNDSNEGVQHNKDSADLNEDRIVHPPEDQECHNKQQMGWNEDPVVMFSAKVAVREENQQ